MTLSRKVDTASSEVQARLNDIPTLSQAIQDGSSMIQASASRIESERLEIQAQLGEISGIGRVTENNSAITRSAVAQIDATQTEALAVARQTRTDLRTLTDEWRNLGSSVYAILLQYSIISMHTHADSRVTAVAIQQPSGHQP